MKFKKKNDTLLKNIFLSNERKNTSYLFAFKTSFFKLLDDATFDILQHVNKINEFLKMKMEQK